MNKKTIIVICLVAIIIAVISIVGINVTKTSNSNKNKENTSKESTIESTSVSNDESKTSNGKVLVVYYSAQNHTKKVAEQIAENLNADTFEIEPKEKYTEDDLDWTNEKSRVSKEHDDESLRNVELKTTDAPNWSDYSVVLIGYPIWWGEAAWPTNTFVKANDFTGKTVYTFCTSVSSGLGQSTKNLAKLANSGTFKDGQRFSSSADNDEIKKFTDSLNID